MTFKSSVSLTDEQHLFAKSLVEAGRYSSVSAVLQQGIDILRRGLEGEALEREALREVLKSRRQGAFVDGAELDNRLARMIAKKRGDHDATD
ncbi:MAG: type II toxin-antitoxin system ParD family antitoxin [Maricaulis sp.]|jgi:antitoxin ParD1/3/4|nr:type II toxin-antitoxin system ParD family antitoxin [Maricaulis sp.]MDG2043142.1 type II toxin-antitoxin system ParD family antitoxin [Maricaulis sp.]